MLVLNTIPNATKTTGTMSLTDRGMRDPSVFQYSLPVVLPLKGCHPDRLQRRSNPRCAPMMNIHSQIGKANVKNGTNSPDPKGERLKKLWTSKTIQTASESDPSTHIAVLIQVNNGESKNRRLAPSGSSDGGDETMGPGTLQQSHRAPNRSRSSPSHAQTVDPPTYSPTMPSVSPRVGRDALLRLLVADIAASVRMREMQGWR